MSKSLLLTADAVVNLVLGALLIAFPRSLVAALGIPPTDATFYPSMLGAVLLGIGIALLVEWRQGGPDGNGLGLFGALCINLAGAVVLAAWLTLGNLEIPTRGAAVLWGLVVLLVGLSALEIAAHLQRRGSARSPN